MSSLSGRLKLSWTLLPTLLWTLWTLREHISWTSQPNQIPTTLHQQMLPWMATTSSTKQHTSAAKKKTPLQILQYGCLIRILILVDSSHHMNRVGSHPLLHIHETTCFFFHLCFIKHPPQPDLILSSSFRTLRALCWRCGWMWASSNGGPKVSKNAVITGTYDP